MIDASRKDKALVIEILSTSFKDNKSVNYLVKQDRWHLERIRLLMDYAFEECMEFGRVVISEDRNACALILFKDRKHFSFKSLFRNLKLVFRVMGLANLFRVLRKERKINLVHQNVKDKHLIYYLWFIGVNTGFQGKGTGTRLLQELLSESRAIGRTMLLETSTVKNLPFYQKNGLKVYHQLEVGYPIYMLKY